MKLKLYTKKLLKNNGFRFSQLMAKNKNLTDAVWQNKFVIRIGVKLKLS